MRSFERFTSSSLQTKLMLVIISLVLLLVLAFSLFTVKALDESLKEQVGTRALQVSRTVANSPIIIQSLQNNKQLPIQEFAEKIRLKTGASFVVVGDKNGLRMAHPRVDRIGKKMVGGDNDKALIKGESYISQAKGSLGVSLRGKTAVKDSNDNIIGVVSVGYLLTEIKDIVQNYRTKFLWFTLFLVTIGALLASLISRGFKKATFGLEPAQIADLLVQKQATLEAVREGIIAINVKGEITTINQAALDYLRVNQSSSYLNRPLREVLPKSGLVSVLDSKEPMLDVELTFNGREFIGNRLPVFADDKLVGAVSSFRPQDEIDELSDSLYRLQQYSELLRVQTHEYANRLHTISGLIQLDAKDEALDLIFKETSGYQDLIQYLAGAVKDPIISGMIIGKYNRAKELGVTLEIDRDGSLKEIPDSIDQRDLVTIVGNLIDNAFEAASSFNKEDPRVDLSFTDIGNDLVFEVEDNGRGISKTKVNQIFEEGFTTKDESGHGLGLMIVMDQLKQLNGEISIKSITAEECNKESKEQPRTIICVYIPKTVYKSTEV